MAGSFWDRRVLAIGGVDFSRLDVVLGAMVRGEWSAFERRLAEGLACVARADADDAAPSEEAIDEAATAYRYDRDLISAADVTAWLDRVELSADEWTEYLRRDLLRRQWAEELDDVLDRYAPSARELVETAVVDGVCSGAFDGFEETFARRAAMVFETDAAEFARACDPLVLRPFDGAQGRPEALEGRQAQDERDSSALAHTHAHWMSLPSESDVVARLALVSRLDKAFTSIAERIAANGHLREIVDDNRLGWMRLEVDTISFDSESAAREAILCVRADGLSLYDVAALSRGTVTRSIATLDDLEPARQQLLLAAEPGAALGPIAVDGHFDVSLLVSRTAPALSDPVIAARAAAVVVGRAQQRAVRDHVTRTVDKRYTDEGRA